MWLTHFWHSWSQFFIFAWDVTAGGILRTGVLICLVIKAEQFHWLSSFWQQEISLMYEENNFLFKECDCSSSWKAFKSFKPHQWLFVLKMCKFFSTWSRCMQLWCKVFTDQGINSHGSPSVPVYVVIGPHNVSSRSHGVRHTYPIVSVFVGPQDVSIRSHGVRHTYPIVSVFVGPHNVSSRSHGVRHTYPILLEYTGRLLTGWAAEIHQVCLQSGANTSDVPV